MEKLSFAKGSREEIRKLRETTLDEIRKEQTDQKEKELAKDFVDYQKGWNKAFMRGVAGIAVILASTYAAVNLPISSAVVAGAGLLGTYLAVTGAATLYRNISSRAANAVKLIEKNAKEREKTREIEDKNRSENREAARGEVRRLKEELKALEIKKEPYIMDIEKWEIENINRRINEKEDSLRVSSPARRELAAKLRPGLVDKLRNGGKQ